MRVCIEGMLKNNAISRELSFSVSEFIGHLKELKDNPKLHEEFFKLYIFSTLEDNSRVSKLNPTSRNVK